MPFSLLFFWGEVDFLAAACDNQLGPPARCLFVYPLFGWEGSPAKIDYRKSGYPYSNLSTGGPSQKACASTNMHTYIYIYIS